MSFWDACRFVQAEILNQRKHDDDQNELMIQIHDHLDYEQFTGVIISMLRDQCGKPDTPIEMNQYTLMGLRRFFKMEQNRQLQRSLQKYFLATKKELEKGPSTMKRLRAIHNTVNTIHCLVSAARFDISDCVFGTPERIELIQAIDIVGINARKSPFPNILTTKCQRISIQLASSSSIFTLCPPVRKRCRASEVNILQVENSSKHYALVKELKQSLFGNIQLAMIVTSSSGTMVATEGKVAIKCVSKQLLIENTALDEDPLKELQCLGFLTNRMTGKLRGPEVIKGDVDRVLPLIDCLEDGDHYYLVMPCLHEDLFEIIHQKGAYSEASAFLLLKDILSGIEAAHSLGLAHHDVSLENLMLDDVGRVVLIDWGMAVKVACGLDGTPVKLKSQAGWPCQCGKKLYYAPEIIDVRNQPAFDPFKLDIWSLGVVLFMLLTGHPPWDVSEGPSFNDSRFQLVISGKISDLLRAWGLTLSDEAVELLQALLSLKPFHRPTIPQIRKFTWFNTEGGVERGVV